MIKESVVPTCRWSVEPSVKKVVQKGLGASILRHGSHRARGEGVDRGGESESRDVTSGDSEGTFSVSSLPTLITL